MRYRKILLIVLLGLFLSTTGCDQLMELIDPTPDNTKPTVSITVEDETPAVNSTQTITAKVYDPDEDEEIMTTWEVTGGILNEASGTETTVQWTAPADTQTVTLKVTVKDSKEATSTATKTVFVGNAPPEITSFTSGKNHVVAGNKVNLSCRATDIEEGVISYRFFTPSGDGTFQYVPGDSNAVWISPPNIVQAKNYPLMVEVTDEQGFAALDTVNVLVYSNDGSLWVVDNGHKSVTKYTSNGLEIVSVGGFTNPVAVTGNVDELYGCFVADQDAGLVAKIDYDGNIVTTFSGITHVADVALHQPTRKLWIISYSEGTITIVDEITGDVEKTITGFNRPSAIEINQWTSDVWVLEESNNRVVQLNAGSRPSELPDAISAANAQFFDKSFNGPSDLFILHTKDEEALTEIYITDTFDDEIERIILSNNIYIKTDPIKTLAHSPILSGTINLSLRDMMMVTSNSGDLEVFVIEDPDERYYLTGNYSFLRPNVLKIDAYSRECWIADNGTNQLVKIQVNHDFTFDVLRKISGFLSIKDIAINY